MVLKEELYCIDNKDKFSNSVSSCKAMHYSRYNPVFASFKMFYMC